MSCTPAALPPCLTSIDIVNCKIINKVCLQPCTVFAGLVSVRRGDLVKQVRTPPVRPADMVRSGRVLLTSARKSKEKS